MLDFENILHYIKDDLLQENEDKILLQSFTYMQEIPGKKIFSQFPIAINYWLQIPDEKFQQIQEIIEMLRSCTLLIDDIEDNSTTRRGIPSAHAIYGVPITLNAAHYSWFLVLEKIQKLGSPEANQIFIEESLKMCRGQGIEIYWRDNSICPTELEYHQMAARKTGGSLMLTIRLMQLFSNEEIKLNDFSRMAAILAVYYQVWDDYRNLTYTDGCEENKSIAEDLTEGKFGFPLIHAVNNKTYGHQVLNILRQRTRDNDMKKFCITLLEKSGSFENTRKFLKNLDKEAREEIKAFGKNPHMDNLLDKMVSCTLTDSGH